MSLNKCATSVPLHISALCLFCIFIRPLLSKIFVYSHETFVRLNSNKRIRLGHSSVAWRVGRFYSTHAANSPRESATLLLHLRPLYDFCNEIRLCFPDQWALLIVLATFFFFQFKVSSIQYVYPEQQNWLEPAFVKRKCLLVKQSPLE